MKEDMLRVLVRSLIKLGLKSPEMEREVDRFRRRPELFSCFAKSMRFNFAKYGFRMELQAPSPDEIDLDTIRYELRDRESNKILISTLCEV